MKKWVLLLALCACGDDDGAPDASSDTGTDTIATDAGEDAGEDTDSGEDADVDAPTDDCLRVTASAWALEIADDVSVGFNASLTPPTEGDRLVVLFERRSPFPDVGTFELGPGTPDENFGDCSHCVYIPIAPDRAYYADRGTLVTRADPYQQIFDATLSNVRLVEVEVDPLTRASTPIAGGSCVELEEVTIDDRFPPDAWSCDDADWADGTACHCECGAFDPDCGVGGECPPFDPGCTPTDPLPLANCPEGNICGFDPDTLANRCTATCDWQAREACESGTCVFNFGAESTDTCYPAGDIRLDTALIGEDCAAGGLQKVCAVADGFATGYCDFAGRCSPICEDDSECTIDGESCQRFIGLDGLGFCSGPPPDDG